MMKPYDDILTAAMGLGEAEKIALADALYESLHAGFDESVKDVWDQEIAERVNRIESGEATLIPGEEAIEQLQRIVDGHEP